jgi:hypothetical protein
MMNKVTAVIVAILVLLDGAMAAARPGEKPGELEAARQQYQQAALLREARAREVYVHKLAAILARLGEERARTGVYGDLKIWKEIFAELMLHPLPADSDPKELSKVIAGKWRSPRRIYDYRKDGAKWVIDADDNDPVESGRWRIEGNKLFIFKQPAGSDIRYTILVLDESYLVFTDGEAVFHHSHVAE